MKKTILTSLFSVIFLISFSQDANTKEAIYNELKKEFISHAETNVVSKFIQTSNKILNFENEIFCSAAQKFPIDSMESLCNKMSLEIANSFIAKEVMQTHFNELYYKYESILNFWNNHICTCIIDEYSKTESKKDDIAVSIGKNCSIKMQSKTEVAQELQSKLALVPQGNISEVRSMVGYHLMVNCPPLKEYFFLDHIKHKSFSYSNFKAVQIQLILSKAIGFIENLQKESFYALLQSISSDTKKAVEQLFTELTLLKNTEISSLWNLNHENNRCSIDIVSDKKIVVGRVKLDIKNSNNKFFISAINFTKGNKIKDAREIIANFNSIPPPLKELEK